MVRTVLSMVVWPGAEREFEEVWATAAHAISDFPGNLSQTLMRDADEHRRYVIFSDWESADALHAFEVSDRRRALSTALEALRESARKNVLDAVTTIGGNGVEFQEQPVSGYPGSRP